MMRAGKLDKTIEIQRHTLSVDDYGTQTEGWATAATVRAQVMQSTTEEFLRSFGTTSDIAIIFRIRHMEGLTPTDRVQFNGQAYNLNEVKELGRRAGLDLRCVAVED
jgi:SPP1 family predicted phage head-tail adaptor